MGGSALPPAWSVRMPASEASGCEQATIPRRAKTGERERGVAIGTGRSWALAKISAAVVPAVPAAAGAARCASAACSRRRGAAAAGIR